MSVLDNPIDYSNHTLFQKREFGDFTAFYVTISICTILGGLLFLLNIVLCCCSKYKHYWKDTNTGNLWLVSIWTKPPNRQIPLDLTELEACPVVVEQYRHEADYTDAPGGYLELQKRESDLWIMSLHVFWPAATVLTMFVVGVILVLLKYGPRLCKTRHTTRPTEYEWEDKTYEQKVFYAWIQRNHYKSVEYPYYYYLRN